MSSWKTYGGIDKFDKTNNVTVNTVVADYFTIKKQFVGDFDVCGNIIISKQLTVDGSVGVKGTLTANSASVYGNLAVNNIDCSSNGFFNNLIVNNDLNFSNYDFLHGDINGIGVNNRYPRSTLDISGNNDSSIHVHNARQVNRNILADNINHNGIALWCDNSSTYVDFFVDTDISVNNTGFDGRIQFDHNGNLLLDANNYVNILPQLVISDLSADIVYNNSIVTIHGDNSSNLFNYDSYRNSSTFTQNAITTVTKDDSSVMFMNIIKPNKKGFSIAGGNCPYDSTRLLGCIGFNDMSENNYVASQTIISGNSTIKYKTTTGINTYKPNVDNYVLDINGPVHIRNGENNIVSRSRSIINAMKFDKIYKNTGIVISELDGSNIPVLYTNDAGRTWKNKNLNDIETLGSSNINTATINLSTLYVYDSNYAFAFGSNFNGFYTYNGGLNWKYIAFNVTYAPKSLYICNNGINNARFFFTASTAGVVQDQLFYYDASINSTSNSGYFNGDTNAIRNLSNPSALSNTNNTSIIDGYGNYIYVVGNEGIYKYDINDLNNAISNHTVSISGNTAKYSAISVFDNSFVVAAGERILSYTRDGGSNWVDFSNEFVYFHPQYYNFVSINIFDESNAIAVSDNGKLAYTNDGLKWNDASYSTMFNLSGSERMLDGSLNDVTIIDKNSFILTNTSIANVDYSSNIIYNYFPDLFNHANNSVLDVSGNMNLYGNITITPDTTNTITIASSASTCNFLTEVIDMYVGRRDSNTVFNGQLTVNGALNATTVKFANTELAYLIINPTDTENIIKNNIQYALDISGEDPSEGTLGGSVRVGDKLDVYGNVSLFGNTKTFRVYSNSFFDSGTTFNNIVNISTNSTSLSVIGNSQFDGTVIVTNPYKSMNIMDENGAFFVNGNTKINNNLYVMSNMLVYGTNNNYYSLEVQNGNVNLIGTLQILNGKIFINNDASFSNNIYVNKNAEFNGDVFVYANNGNKFIVNTDSNFNGNIFVGPSTFTYDGKLIMNNDASFNNNLLVNGDASFNNKVFVNGDVSFNNNLLVGGNVSLNRNIEIGGDSSFNGNIYFGDSVIRNDGTFTMNKAASFNANLTVNSNNGSFMMVNSDVSFNGNVNFNGGSKITNSGGITMNSDANFNGILNAGDATFSGGVNFGGNSGTRFGDDGTFTLNGDSTFNKKIINFNESILNITSGTVYLQSSNKDSLYSFTARTEFTGPALFDGGTVNFTGQVSSLSGIEFTSDYRIKTDIVPIINTELTIDSLNPVFFHNIISKKNDIGFIAHELQEHLPFLVNGEKDGERYQSINYTGLIGLLVNEVQSLKKRVSVLENKLMI
jgi:hypothetical protein